MDKKVLPLIIGILIIVGVGGYLMYSGKLNFNQVTPAVSQSSAVPLDKTNDFKIYTNIKYGYSFEYPQQLELKLGVIGLGGDEDKLETTSSLQLIDSVQQPPQGLSMWINAGKTSYENIEEYSKVLGKSKPSSKEFPVIVSKEKTSLDGIPALKYTHNNPGEGLVLSVFTIKNAHFYEFSLSFSDNNSQNIVTFDKILSSFKVAN